MKTSMVCWLMFLVQSAMQAPAVWAEEKPGEVITNQDARFNKSPRFAASKPFADQVRAGKLIRHGFTAGVALAVHLALEPHRQREVATSVMPYVAWLPGRYATRGYISRAYCAESWNFGNSQNEADALAVEDAVAYIKQEGKLPTSRDKGEQEAQYSKGERAEKVEEYLADPQSTPARRTTSLDGIPGYLHQVVAGGGSLVSTLASRVLSRPTHRRNHQIL